MFGSQAGTPTRTYSRYLRVLVPHVGSLVGRESGRERGREFGGLARREVGWSIRVGCGVG